MLQEVSDKVCIHELSYITSHRKVSKNDLRYFALSFSLSVATRLSCVRVYIQPLDFRSTLVNMSPTITSPCFNCLQFRLEGRPLSCDKQVWKKCFQLLSQGINKIISSVADGLQGGSVNRDPLFVHKLIDQVFVHKCC